MGLKEWAIKRMFGDEISRAVKNGIDSQLPERIAAAASSGMTLSAEDMKWRKLTGNADRDLLPVTQARMQDIAYYLVETNPLAGWLIDITTAFILAEGIPYECENPEVKQVLDDFWNDPVNRMALYFPKHVNELQTFGELCFPVFTAQQTGRVRLGYTDPGNIDDVITDPDNVRMTIGVLTKPWTGSIGGIAYNSTPKKYSVILPEGANNVLSPVARQIREQLTDGECFFWAINNTTNSPRGRSSLLSVADWLDVYEQFLFDLGDKWPQFNSFVWDLLVTGGGKTEIEEQIKLFNKKPGSVFGHNEKITLDAVTPDLKAADAETASRIFRNHILGRFGYPEHWYGGGGDVNRGTASEMDRPAVKMMSNKQLTVKYIKEDMLNYQIRKAREARYLRVTDEQAAFTTTLPEMGTKDVSKLATAAQQVATSLGIAEQQGWIDKDTARRIFSSIVSFTGVEMDFEEIKNKLLEEKDKKGYEDYIRRDTDKKPPLEIVNNE